MRIAVVGASGRMGRAVIRLARAQGVPVVCAAGTSDVGKDAGELAGIGPIGVLVGGLGDVERTHADVVIDFSSPQATLALAPLAAAAGSALVSGTTGLADDGRAALEVAAARVPVLWEPNMSIGVHVLSQLVAQATAALADWNVEIVETHHSAKIDAPSGTAMRLAEVARGAPGGGHHFSSRTPRHPGARNTGEIGMHALRGGDIVGDHVVHFMGGGERLELTHRATSRDVFAHGALRAARWIAGKPPGQYTLNEVLRDPLR